MQNIMRVSVRGLVEFTLHGEDIYPTGGALRDMQEGALGHKARQALLGEGWQAEVPLSLTVPADDDGGGNDPFWRRFCRYDESLRRPAQ